MSLNKRLVYVLSTKLGATPDELKAQAVGCGMLLDQDIDGISLKALPQYKFEPPTNVNEEHKRLAERLNIGLVWQKLQHLDATSNTTLSFGRLLFIDYDTETKRKDYPAFAEQGIYYEVGELVPYICIDESNKQVILYTDVAYQGYQIEQVLLSINDPKYANNEYSELFASQINLYQQLFATEATQYNFSLTQQSTAKSLFMPLEEWQENLDILHKKLADPIAASNAQSAYQLLLQKQAHAINEEIIAVLSAEPIDLRTIDEFQEQLSNLKKQMRIIFHELPSIVTTYDHEVDDIITDISQTDGPENAMALQDLLTYILNSLHAGDKKANADLILQSFTEKELTILRAYKIFNICIYYLL